MRRIAFFVSLLLAVAALLGSGAKFLLLATGDTTEGRITRVLDQEVETEIKRQRRSSSRATGYFRIDVAVAYTFDVLPTATEALRRASDAPLHVGVSGSDTVYWRTRDSAAEPLHEGQPVRILFLRPWPAWNRVHQPGTIKGEVATWAGAGLAFAAVAFFLRPRRPGTRPRPA